jgi:hypothetical protein
VNKDGLEAVRWLLLHTALWVGGIFALVGSTMALMTIWVSAKTAGFIWCGFMFVAVIVFFSWMAYTVAKDESERKAKELNLRRRGT